MVIIMRLLTCEEMKLVEGYAAKCGISYKLMMENAGVACARNIRNEIEKNGMSWYTYDYNIRMGETGFLEVLYPKPLQTFGRFRNLRSK